MSFAAVYSLYAVRRLSLENAPEAYGSWKEWRLLAFDAPTVSIANLYPYTPSQMKRGLPDCETVWHEGRHWGKLRNVLETHGSQGAVAPSDMVSRFIHAIYDAPMAAAWAKGKVLNPSERIVDIEEDFSTADLSDAIQAAQSKFRIVEGLPVMAGSEPMIAVKTDNRPLKGQDQGFKEWLGVETVLATSLPLPRDKMYFRFDQVDLLREVAGKARLVDLDRAVGCVRLLSDETHVFDTWTESALGYLERRAEAFKQRLSGSDHDFVEAWCDLEDKLKARDINEDNITDAFADAIGLLERAPDPLDTRWLAKRSLEIHQAHWDSRPMGLSLSVKNFNPV